VAAGTLQKTPHCVHCPRKVPSPVLPTATDNVAVPTPGGTLQVIDVRDIHSSRAQAVSPTFAATPGAAAEAPKYSPMIVTTTPPSVAPLSGDALCGPCSTQAPRVCDTHDSKRDPQMGAQRRKASTLPHAKCFNQTLVTFPVGLFGFGRAKKAQKGGKILPWACNKGARDGEAHGTEAAASSR